MASDWISRAIKKPGALTRQAKAAGKSPMSFARSHRDSKGVIGRRSRLAITLAGFHRSGKFKKGSR